MYWYAWYDPGAVRDEQRARTAVARRDQELEGLWYDTHTQYDDQICYGCTGALWYHGIIPVGRVEASFILIFLRAHVSGAVRAADVFLRTCK